MANLWNLLVVDDEPMNLEIICDHLEDGPFNITTAENGQEALNHLNHSDQAIDLIILDRMMPVMNGMELLNHLKGNPKFSGIHVIMQTAAATPDQIRDGLKAGCYYYLTKPYNPNALNSIINSALADLAAKRSLSDELKQIPAIPKTEYADYQFTTLEETHKLALLLASQCPEPATAVMGISELLINAIEHGNLGISYQEKTLLKRSDSWQDEIARRLQLPEYKHKKATVSFKRDSDALTFTITDEGEGFDWTSYMEFDPRRSFDPNGRGIAMAKTLTFSQIDYIGKGNQLIAKIRL